jgi:hypothetical protein
MKNNKALEKVIGLLCAESKESDIVDFSFAEKPFGLVAGLFISNPLIEAEPFKMPVSRVEGKEIIAFAPVGVTFLDDFNELDLVFLVPSQGTSSDVKNPSYSKLRVKFLGFDLHLMSEFEAGTPRRFAHFEIIGGYSSSDLSALSHAVSLRIEADEKLPGKMTFEV